MTVKTRQTCWSGKEGAAKEGRERRVVKARKGITRKPTRRSLMIPSIGSVQPPSLPPFPPYSRLPTASDFNDIRLAWFVLDDT
jgi:hypothetical protein